MNVIIQRKDRVKNPSCTVRCKENDSWKLVEGGSTFENWEFYVSKSDWQNH